jgi:hypothetical protein
MKPRLVKEVAEAVCSLATGARGRRVYVSSRKVSRLLKYFKEIRSYTVLKALKLLGVKYRRLNRTKVLYAVDTEELVEACRRKGFLTG